MNDNLEDNEMAILEKKLNINLDKIKQIAKANTVKNAKGQTVITKDDPFREESDFQSSIKSDNKSKL
ncbi:MAG: hypothetical protein AB7V16_13555 [Vulcanibacillus sp.]